MRRIRYIPVVLGVVVCAAVGAHAALSSHTAVSQTMHAFDHDDESIGLRFDDGSDVGNQARNAPVIPPGTYTIVAVDDSGAHNFHLTGRILGYEGDVLVFERNFDESIARDHI